MHKRMTEKYNPQALNTITFSQILNNQFDITETYWYPDMGGLVSELIKATQTINPWIPGLRQIMQRNQPKPGEAIVSPALLKQQDWENLEAEWFWNNHQKGNIASVDGTIIFPHTKFILTQVFAVGVGVYNSAGNTNTELTATRTVANFIEPPSGIPTFEQIKAAIDQTKFLTQDKTWSHTWRDYRERIAAINTKEEIIYIDGAIITQNLVAQQHGRKIMRDLHNTGKLCIGVIKDIRTSQQTLRWFSRALEDNEVFLITNLKNLVIERLEDWSENPDIVSFLDDVAQHYVRGIYKPGKKVFGFECLLSEIPKALAMLFQDCNGVVGHEIPYMLDKVDSDVRGKFRPHEAEQYLYGKLAEHYPGQTWDEMNERFMR